MPSLRIPAALLLASSLAAYGQAPAACAVNAAAIRKGEARLPSYLGDSPEQLKAAVPALHGIKFALSQDAAKPILEKVAAAIAEMVPRVPNLIAEERLTQIRVALPYQVAGMDQGGSSGAKPGGRLSSMQSYSSTTHTLQGEELHQALHAGLAATTAKPVIFGYRIHSVPNAALGEMLDEYRVDAENHPVVMSDLTPGSPAGVGFGNSWLLFRPENLKQHDFRYLGRQKVDGHESLVIAFAQIPELVALPAQIGLHDGTCSFFTQGVVWIDEASSRILRIQTDLLAPLLGISLRQLRSSVQFREVTIASRGLVLWLPSEVEIQWETADQAGGELHRYAGYRLFGATSTVTPMHD
jgi:hypothetical protein